MEEEKEEEKEEEENLGLHFLLFFNCTYITNLKTGVDFHDIFQSRKGFHRRKILKSTALAICC